MKYEVNKISKIRSDYGKEVLKSRGVKDLDAFLHPTEKQLQDWHDLYDIGDAIKGMEAALSCDSPYFALVVDCDVDGFTSASILYQYIKDINSKAKIDYYIHSGKQHGLSDIYEKIIDKDIHYTLCLVPDAGSNDYEYIEKLGERSTPTLVLDHHIVEETTTISDWCFIVNNQMSPNYYNKDLSGAGITYQFCRALDDRFGTNYALNYIDLAALGICADMMSALSEENQYFWSKGFKNINNYFFQVLCEKQSYSMGGRINPTTVAFYIVPMINALIRVGTEQEKERLFMAFIDGHTKVVSGKRGAKGALEEVAIESARECTNAKAHQDKKKNEIVEKLEVKIAKNDLLENKILFIRLEDDDDFPSELNGLVAMQLSTKYNRPTIVARLNDEGYIRGSARGLNKSALASFKSYLNNTHLFEYTIGHDNAFGISIKNSDLANFHKIANEELKDYDFGENIYFVDFERECYETDLKDIIYDLTQYIDYYGQQCAEPLIAVKDLIIHKNNIQCIGRNSDTLKIEKNGIVYIKFFARELIDDLMQYGDEIKITVVGTANVNEWMGTVTPQIFIKDIEIEEVNNLAF